jgi:phage-related protein
MKSICFLGDSLKAVREFPSDARQDAGYQLERVQRGQQPLDFKAMPAIGNGVEEIRMRHDPGAFRVIYTARFEDAVYVYCMRFRKNLKKQHCGTLKKRGQDTGN